METARPEFLSYGPWAAAYLLLLAALTVQQILAHRRAFAPGLSRRYGPALSPWRAGLKWILLCAAGWQLLLALATPLGAPVKVEGAASGADVILAVDVSSSMYAQDIAPNRLLALKDGLGRFISRLGGDRVALVAFAGEAVIACPLTTDYDTATLFLEKLETDSVPRDGTGLAPAIKRCLDDFAADSKRGRMIILASDGEDTIDSDTAEQAGRAGSLGIPIYTLGIGTPGGGMIPGRPDIFGRVAPKMYKGQPVVTRLNSDTLRRIAELSGGRYFAGASRQGIDAAYEAVRGLKQGAAKSKDRYVRDPLYQKPLLWALVLLILEMLISNRSGGTSRALARAWAWVRGLWSGRRAAAGLLALFLLPAALRPLGLELDPGRKEYNAGNEAFRKGDFEAALEHYKKSADLNPGRPELDYNAGVALHKLGDVEGAVGAYADALAKRPDDPDAKANYELALKQLPKSQSGPGGSGQPSGPEKGGWRKRKPQKSGNQPGQPGGQPHPQGQGRSPGSGPGSTPGGQAPGQQPGQKPGQGQSGAPGQGQSQDLSEDQIHAMMNMLKNDQRRFGNAFQPLQKHQAQQQSQDPFDELFEQMTGRRLKPQESSGGGGDRKDW